MRCAICRHGQLTSGTTSVTLTRESMTLVFRNVPADVCDTCGEAYVDEETATRLLAIAEQAAANGVQVEVREYVAA